MRLGTRGRRVAGTSPTPSGPVRLGTRGPRGGQHLAHPLRGGLCSHICVCVCMHTHTLMTGQGTDGCEGPPSTGLVPAPGYSGVVEPRAQEPGAQLSFGPSLSLLLCPGSPSSGSRRTVSNMPTKQGCQAPWKRAAVCPWAPSWAGQRSAPLPSFWAPIHTTDAPSPVPRSPICPLPGISLCLQLGAAQAAVGPVEDGGPGPVWILGSGPGLQSSYLLQACLPG